MEKKDCSKQRQFLDKRNIYNCQYYTVTAFRGNCNLDALFIRKVRFLKNQHSLLSQIP